MKKYCLLLIAFLLVTSSFNKTIQGEESEIDHSINVGEPDDKCLRPVDGQFSFDIKEDKRPVDLVIVQDASGSFRENVGTVKDAVTQSVSSMKDHDRVMLTSYRGGNKVKLKDGRSVEVNSVPTTIGTLHHLSKAKDLSVSYSNLQLGGGTPTASGLKYAIDQYQSIRAQESEDRKTVFLLITDGVANIRLDDHIHKLNNNIADQTTTTTSSLEYNQDYKGALAEVQNLMGSVNGSNYEMAVGFWESYSQLSSPTQYYDKYESEVGPFVKSGLSSNTSTPGHFIAERDINTFANRLSGLIENSVIPVPETNVEMDIHPKLDLKEMNIITDNGEKIEHQVNGSKVSFKVPAGSDIRNVKVNYKLKENEKITIDESIFTNAFVQQGNHHYAVKDAIIPANTKNCDTSTEEPTTEEPTTEEPTTEEPTTEEPTTEEPTTEEPTTEEPTTEEPTAEEPTTEEPTTEEPTTEEPTTEEPTTEEPTTEEPTTEEPTTEEPTTEEPTTEEPTTEEPTTEEPTTEEPTTEEPTTEEPTTEEPTTEEPTTEEPTTEEPTTEEPTTEEPTTEEPTTEEPTTEEPTTEEPTTEEPTTEEPTTEEPTTEEPTTEEPTTEEPTTEEPTTEEATTEEPTTEEPHTPSNGDSSKLPKPKNDESKNGFLPNTGEAIGNHPIIITLIGIFLLLMGIGLVAYRRKK